MLGTTRILLCEYRLSIVIFDYDNLLVPRYRPGVVPVAERKKDEKLAESL